MTTTELLATIRAFVEEQIKKYHDPDDYFIPSHPILGFLDTLSVDAPDFPTTDEEMEKFLANTPPVDVPDKYKNPDWLFKCPMKQDVHCPDFVPKGLDEAAEEYASDYPAYNDEQAIAKYAFKRGAEWAFGQMKEGAK